MKTDEGKERTVTLSFRITETQLEVLDALADALNRNRSDVVRSLIEVAGNAVEDILKIREAAKEAERKAIEEALVRRSARL
jgi:predicted DNA-binding protein